MLTYCGFLRLGSKRKVPTTLGSDLITNLVYHGRALDSELIYSNQILPYSLS